MLLFILLEKVLLLNVGIIVFQCTLQRVVVVESNFFLSFVFSRSGFIFAHHQIAEVSIFFQKMAIGTTSLAVRYFSLHP